MRTICAWCKKNISGEEDFPGQPSSHGMCDECYKKVKKQTQEALEKDRQRASGE